MDANIVLFDLKDKDFISDGDVKNITEMKDKEQQNKFLHAHIKEKCTTEALMTICDIITSVKGNTRMVNFGQTMKNMLTGT